MACENYVLQCSPDSYYAAATCAGDAGELAEFCAEEVARAVEFCVEVCKVVLTPIGEWLLE